MASNIAKPGEVGLKDGKRQDKSQEAGVKYIKEEDKSPQVALKPCRITDNEVVVLYCLSEKPIGGAFFSELQEGTGLNPRALSQAIKRLVGQGYLQSIRPGRGTTGKDLAADEWEHAKTVSDPEEKAMAERFATMLEETNPQRRIYYATEEGVVAYIANVLEYGVAQGWNTRTGEPFDPEAMYYRTPEGSRYFGLPIEE